MSDHPLQVHVDPGGEGYVKWAKARLRGLGATRRGLALPILKKYFQVDPSTRVDLISSEFGDKIRVFSSGDLGTTFLTNSGLTARRRFNVRKGGAPSALPPADRSMLNGGGQLGRTVPYFRSQYSDCIASSAAVPTTLTGTMHAVLSGAEVGNLAPPSGMGWSMGHSSDGVVWALFKSSSGEPLQALLDGELHQWAMVDGTPTLTTELCSALFPEPSGTIGMSTWDSNYAFTYYELISGLELRLVPSVVVALGRVAVSYSYVIASSSDGFTSSAGSGSLNVVVRRITVRTRCLTYKIGAGLVAQKVHDSTSDTDVELMYTTSGGSLDSVLTGIGYYDGDGSDLRLEYAFDGVDTFTGEPAPQQQHVMSASSGDTIDGLDVHHMFRTSASGTGDGNWASDEAEDWFRTPGVWESEIDVKVGSSVVGIISPPDVPTDEGLGVSAVFKPIVSGSSIHVLSYVSFTTSLSADSKLWHRASYPSASEEIVEQTSATHRYSLMSDGVTYLRHDAGGPVTITRGGSDLASTTDEFSSENSLFAASSGYAFWGLSTTSNPNSIMRKYTLAQDPDTLVWSIAAVDQPAISDITSDGQDWSSALLGSSFVPYASRACTFVFAP